MSRRPANERMTSLVASVQLLLTTSTFQRKPIGTCCSTTCSSARCSSWQRFQVQMATVMVVGWAIVRWASANRP